MDAISSVIVNVWFSERVPSWSSLLLGVCLDAAELSAPVLREHPAPVVNRAKRFRVDAIHRLPALATHVDEADVTQHLKVLRDRRLAHLEGISDFGDGALLAGDELQNVPPAGSAMALKGSDVVDARATPTLYIPIWEYVKPEKRRDTVQEISESRKHLSGAFNRNVTTV